MIGSARFAGWTSIVGASIGVAITPFMAAVWAYRPGVVWDNLSLLVKVVGPTLESWGALTFGNARLLGAGGTVLAESTPYEVYGKVFFLVYLLMLPIVRYVHELHRDSAPSKWEAKAWRVLWIALVLATVGDAVSYWGISLPGLVGDALWRLGFVVEILAMLVVLTSTTVYGALSIRLRVIPLWSSVPMTLIVPIGVVTLVTITTYVPNAIVVPMSIIWALIGAWVLTNQGKHLRPDSEPQAART